MGWAIQRPDGTYRAWNANAQDDVLQPGEIWKSLESAPLVTVPQAPPHPPNPLIALIGVVLASSETSQSLKNLLTAWRAQL